MKVVFVILLLAIPVPVAALFTNLVLRRKRTESAQVLKKE